MPLKNPSDKQRQLAAQLRNIVFGIEDSLVSTVGLLSGIAVADVSRRNIFLTGIVLVFVEAFSMAAGAFLSESSAAQYLKQKDTSSRISIGLGAIMFVSYFISGFVPLLPYVFFPSAIALPISIIASVVALGCLGIWGARTAKASALMGCVRMVLIGGLAITLGMIVGRVVHGLGGIG